MIYSFDTREYLVIKPSRLLRYGVFKRLTSIIHNAYCKNASIRHDLLEHLYII